VVERQEVRTVKRGDYYKVCGGYHGAVWTGTAWVGFGCDACGLTTGLLQRRLQGPMPPKAIKAMISKSPHKHDRATHARWHAAKAAVRVRYNRPVGSPVTLAEVRAELQLKETDR